MSKIQYDSIFVCQLKTTCYQNDESFNNKEVIEFGGCLLNIKTLQTYDPFSLIVKPNGEVTPYCTKRTGLTPDDVSSGVSFIDLLGYIEEVYGISSRPWASYGSFAKHVLEIQCQKENIIFPLSDRFLNVKSLFPVIFNLYQEVSLRDALKKLSLEIPDGDDCRDDAINTSIVLRESMRGPGMLRKKENFVTCMTKR